MNRIGIRGLAGLSVLVAAALVAVETLFVHGRDGSFLLTLTFWTMIIHGGVALAAVAEVSKGLWLIPVKRDLLALYPLLLFTAVIYLLFGIRVHDIYAWAAEPTAWMNVRLFMIRNFVILLVSFFIGRQLAMAVLHNRPNKNMWAVLFVTVFITSQSMVAFDWLMSLAYPWVSTLFGGYFFIQAFLMGLILCSYILFFRIRAGAPALKETLRDNAKMMFAFCFMWGGFMFAQYLVIWYGNLPEEVAYLYQRVVPEPYFTLSRLVVLLVFILPFVSLVSRKIKTEPFGMVLVATVVLSGLLLEKIVMIAPVVPINPVIVVVEFALMALLVSAFLANRDAYMPKGVTAAAGGHGHDATGDLASAHHR
jgi:hypothetical protein